jgi:hypothetical protein
MEVKESWLTKLILIYHQWVDLIQVNMDFRIKVLLNEMDNKMANRIYQVVKKYKQEPDKDKEVVDHWD